MEIEMLKVEVDEDEIKESTFSYNAQYVEDEKLTPKPNIEQFLEENKESHKTIETPKKYENGVLSDLKLNETPKETNPKQHKSQKLRLQEHIEIVHLNIKQHKCHLCDYVAAQKGNLKAHIQSVHFNIKKHKCHLCCYGSARKVRVQEHIESVHLNIKKNKCNLCDYAAVQKGHLKVHIESVHLNIKKHKCHLCKYACSRKADLKAHKVSIHSTVK
ncbi:zinc finger X-chromosomal protein-like [Harmonia axyridis]|uniref:zinc finger X-chromosomal protein-like n=1 Tax=Harmonia axyridis TaxID=115357 RepID=UPI001E2793FC|nr:zinc finger X-chromosomal protein-like [Harmonia axyridis]